MIQDPLALKILDGEVLHGDHVIVDADLPRRQMDFKVSRRAAPERASPARSGDPGRVGKTAPARK
jgi:ATP-dependent Clp protease ATP-binding subunit ClpB